MGLTTRCLTGHRVEIPCRHVQQETCVVCVCVVLCVCVCCVCVCVCVFCVCVCVSCARVCCVCICVSVRLCVCVCVLYVCERWVCIYRREGADRSTTCSTYGIILLPDRVVQALLLEQQPLLCSLLCSLNSRVSVAFGAASTL